jgi:hypothetical protein
MRRSRIALLAILTGCAASDSTSPATDINALVDQMSGSGLASYSTAALQASGITTGLIPAPTGGSPCTYSASTQFFDCAPVTLEGMTVTRAYQLLDDSGRPLSVPDPRSVAAIRAVSELKGTPTTGTGVSAVSLTLDRHEDATMTGLLSATHLVNGTATQTATINATGTTITLVEADTTSNLQLPQPTAHESWPLGGSLIANRTVTVGSLAATTSRDVITFEGTSVMTVSHTMSGVTQTCAIDLAKPTVLPACH